MTQNTQTTAEKMANLAHEIWARWMRYMFTKCIFQTDGGILIPGKMAERWTRQMETRYPDLPESEKQSDRDIANEYMFCAEIDALTRERDEARAELAGLDAGMRFQFDRAEDYKAQRDEARAEVTRRMSDIDAARNTIVELESDRNGANAFLDEVAFILKVPPAYMGGVNGWAEVKMCELAEARAEVERLRPAAEAWEAQENSASIFMRYLRGHAPYEDTITAEGNAKAARARAAKGTP